MVLFSCVTENINQLTKCHYKGNILNCDFPFFLSLYEHPAKFICIWLKELHVEIKTHTLKLSVALNKFSMPLRKSIACEI